MVRVALPARFPPGVVAGRVGDPKDTASRPISGRSFGGEHRGSQWCVVEAALQAIRDALWISEIPALSDKRREPAWGRLAEACLLLASKVSIRCNDALIVLVKLLRLAANPYLSRAGTGRWLRRRVSEGAAG